MLIDTGQAVAISHYNVISIVIQCATFNRINEPYSSWSEQRFRPGDICFGCEETFIIFAESPSNEKIGNSSTVVSCASFQLLCVLWLMNTSDIYGLVYNVRALMPDDLVA